MMSHVRYQKEVQLMARFPFLGIESISYGYYSMIEKYLIHSGCAILLGSLNFISEAPGILLISPHVKIANY